MPFFSKEHGKRMKNHLSTAFSYVAGMIQSKSSHMSHAGSKTAIKIKSESAQENYRRLIKNPRVTANILFTPFIKKFMNTINLPTYYVVIDGSTVGRNGLALMASVVYQGRGIPLTWIVKNGKKGHFPVKSHVSMIRKIKALLPPDADVVILGDGEFDGVKLLAEIERNNWQYVTRTAHTNTLITAEGEVLKFSKIRPGQGDCNIESDVAFTDELYEVVSAVAWWGKSNDEPIYLISNMDNMLEIISTYKKRFSIETFFCDQKSKGFKIDKSRVSAPVRLSKLLAIACLAYIWIVYLGVVCKKKKLQHEVHRKSRCDLTIFQLGFRMLDHLLNRNKKIPIKLGNSAFWT